jgi:hypothetical protein
MNTPSTLTMNCIMPSCRNMLTTEATIRPIRPMIRKLPNPVRSFLVV